MSLYYLIHVLLWFVVDSEDVTINVPEEIIKLDFIDDDITICVGVNVNPIITNRVMKCINVMLMSNGQMSS